MPTLPLLRVASLLALAATHPSTAHAEPNVVSTCEVRWSNPTAVVVAEAHALPEPAASTTVTCTVTRNPGEEITVRATMPGPAVVAASTGTLGPAAFTVCSSSTATWVDVEDLTVTERTEAEHCYVAYGDG